MAKWYIGHGIDDFIAEMQALDKATDAMCGKAIYEGAKIVADEMRKAIENLPEQKTVKGHTALVRGVTKSQKKGLLDGFGISPKQQTNGIVNVKLGFEGYNDTVTQKYPEGQPNAMIARTIESGNSWHQKTPFIAPTRRKCAERAEEAMKLSIQHSIEDFSDRGHLYF